LTKSITSSDNLNIQRRCAPIVIGELEIADRFQMKSVIDFVKLGNCQSIVQILRYEAVPNFSLPRYLTKWLTRLGRLPLSC